MGKTPVAPPVTLADLQNETQQLQDVVALQHKQFSQQQTELTTKFTTDLQNMHAALNRLERTIINPQDTNPAANVFSDEECPAPPPGQTPDGKLLLGEAEWLWLDDAHQAFQARIDTGADTSSISANDITIFERNSKKWVRFYMSHQDMHERILFKAPLVRHARVRQASTDDLDRRPVVRLAVHIGIQNEKAEFTLTDRSNMRYPVMLGRDFLKDIAMVDVSRKNIQPKPRLKDVR